MSVQSGLSWTGITLRKGGSAGRSARVQPAPRYVDSLPKQPIDSLLEENRKKAYMRVGLLCAARMKGVASEEELAKDAGFPSVDAMRISLTNWGLSALLPHTAEEKKPKERKAQRHAGGAEKLPSASRASRLFEAALSTYQGDLYFMDRLEEYLGEDNLFHAYFVYPPEDTKWPREAFSLEEWEKLCAERGLDPACTEELIFSVDKRSGSRGAFRHPDKWLTFLIGAYLLRMRSWQDVERLVEKLHRSPQEADWEKIKTHLVEEPGKRDGLWARAEQLAILIRGGELKQGRKYPLDMYDHGTALDIRIAREQGIPEEEIERIIREGRGLGEDEYKRLAGKFPPDPLAE